MTVPVLIQVHLLEPSTQGIRSPLLKSLPPFVQVSDKKKDTVNRFMVRHVLLRVHLTSRGIHTYILQLKPKENIEDQVPYYWVMAQWSWPFWNKSIICVICFIYNDNSMLNSENKTCLVWFVKYCLHFLKYEIKNGVSNVHFEKQGKIVKF